MNWVEEQHAGVALVKPPLMLKSVREKDFREINLRVILVEYLCVPLTLVTFSFIVACLINGQ